MTLIILGLVLVAVLVALWPKQERREYTRDDVAPEWREMEDDGDGHIIGSYEEHPTLAWRRAPDTKE